MVMRGPSIDVHLKHPTRWNSMRTRDLTERITFHTLGSLTRNLTKKSSLNSSTRLVKKILTSHEVLLKVSIRTGRRSSETSQERRVESKMRVGKRMRVARRMRVGRRMRAVSKTSR